MAQDLFMHCQTVLSVTCSKSTQKRLLSQNKTKKTHLGKDVCVNSYSTRSYLFKGKSLGSTGLSTEGFNRNWRKNVFEETLTWKPWKRQCQWRQQIGMLWSYQKGPSQWKQNKTKQNSQINLAYIAHKKIYNMTWKKSSRKTKRWTAKTDLIKLNGGQRESMPDSNNAELAHLKLRSVTGEDDRKVIWSH